MDLFEGVIAGKKEGEKAMEVFLNVCVLITLVFAFGYLGYVILWPERF